MTQPPANPAVPAPGWFADPVGRHEYRYWDGARWTDHVASNGNQSVDPLAAATPHTVTSNHSAEQVQAQVQKHLNASARRGAPGAQASPVAGQAASVPYLPGQTGPAGMLDPVAAGGSPLYGHAILVVNQKGKLIELTNEYVICDQFGNQVGAVRQVGQSVARKAVRMLTNFDQFLTTRLQIVDQTGAVVLMLTRPAKVFKSRLIVQDGAGTEIGQIVQQNVFGKIRFDFEAHGQRIGGIFAENWRAWNFRIEDARGQEVARITKTFAGVIKAAFTTADHYVFQVHQPMAPPLLQLVFASAVTVDTALKQDEK